MRTLKEAIQHSHDNCEPECCHADEASPYLEDLEVEALKMIVASLRKDEDQVCLILRALWAGIHIGVAWKGADNGSNKAVEHINAKNG